MACTRHTRILPQRCWKLCRMLPSTYGHGRNLPPAMVLGWPSLPLNPCTRKWISPIARNVCLRPTIMARRMILRSCGLPWRDTIKASSSSEILTKDLMLILIRLAPLPSKLKPRPPRRKKKKMMTKRDPAPRASKRRRKARRMSRPSHLQHKIEKFAVNM